MGSQITRRTVAKSAAWATPVVLATTLVPAYAASKCTPQLQVSPGATFTTSQPVPGTVTGEANISFGRVQVTGLPSGVTVTKISVTYDVEQHTTARGTQSPGYPSPFETYISKRTGASAYSTTSWAQGSSYNFYDSKNSWTGNKVVFEGGNRSIQWSDGVSRSSWAVTNTWVAGTAGDPRTLQTTTNGSGCSTVTLPEMGQLTMTGTYATTSMKVQTYVTAVVTLSNGQQLRIAGQSTY